MACKTIIVRLIFGGLAVLFLYLLSGFLYPFYANVSNVTVKGKVTSRIGDPKEGIEIVLRNFFFNGYSIDYEPSEKQSTYTDSNGEFMFKIKKGDWIHVDTTDNMASPVFQAQHTSHFKKTMRFDLVLNE